MAASASARVVYLTLLASFVAGLKILCFGWLFRLGILNSICLIDIVYAV